LKSWSTPTSGIPHLRRPTLKRSELKDKVVPAGQKIRLVEAGNHCQGASSAMAII